MQELFSNGKISIPQFDFQIGFGEGIIPALNYYGFGDPFVLTFAVFFSKYPVYTKEFKKQCYYFYYYCHFYCARPRGL